jgi:hypothetical protein
MKKTSLFSGSAFVVTVTPGFFYSPKEGLKKWFNKSETKGRHFVTISTVYCMELLFK